MKNKNDTCSEWTCVSFFFNFLLSCYRIYQIAAEAAAAATAVQSSIMSKVKYVCQLCGTLGCSTSLFMPVSAAAALDRGREKVSHLCYCFLVSV